MNYCGTIFCFLSTSSGWFWSELQRLAAAEEVLPFPLLHLSDSSTFAETENSVKQSLLEIELRDYNPLLHDSGFHQKLNLLMKESPPFGLLPARDDSVASVLCPPDQILTSNSVIDLATTTPDTIRNVPNHSFESVIDLEAVQTGILPVDLPKAEDNGVACFTGDWDNLIVDNISMITSQPSAPKSSAEKSRTASLLNCRPRDTRTSRIMERLEPPRQTKPRVQTTVGRSEILPNTHGVTDSSRLMRPIFSMVKSKKKWCVIHFYSDTKTRSDQRKLSRGSHPPPPLPSVPSLVTHKYVGPIYFQNKLLLVLVIYNIYICFLQR